VAQGVLGDLRNRFKAINMCHRRMMKEYLCRSYVAEEILSDMGLSSTARADSRVGRPAAAPNASSRTRPAGGQNSRPRKIDLSAIKESLLADQGSSHYKNWLAR
jgi:hypothetical protein